MLRMERPGRGILPSGTPASALGLAAQRSCCRPIRPTVIGRSTPLRKFYPGIPAEGKGWGERAKECACPGFRLCHVERLGDASPLFELAQPRPAGDAVVHDEEAAACGFVRHGDTSPMRRGEAKRAELAPLGAHCRALQTGRVPLWTPGVKGEGRAPEPGRHQDAAESAGTFRRACTKYAFTPCRRPTLPSSLRLLQQLRNELLRGLGSPRALRRNP